MKKMNFNKNELWDCSIFYTIYMFDNEKYIKIRSKSDREDKGKEYLSWIITEYNFCYMPLKDFLEWGSYYQLSKLIEKCEYEENEYEPQEAFELANKFIKGEDGLGSTHLTLSKLTENVSCGNYYD